MNYSELTELRQALVIVSTLGPKYVRPSYLNGVFNALANVEKQLLELDNQEPLLPLF